MKKTLLFLTLIISGCSSSNFFADNDKCISMNKFEIFQAVDGGALAHECTFSEGCSAFNQLVFLKEQRGMDYYDGLVVKVPTDKCAVQDGVYRYTTKQEVQKTVPFIKFEYKNDPKTEEEFFQRLQESKEDTYYSCLQELKKDNSVKNKTKLCTCLADSIEESIVSLLKNATSEAENGEKNQNFDEEAFGKKMIKNAEKKCGKLPKALLPE